jgi:hypothetical protein
MVGNLMLKQSRPIDATEAFARALEVQPDNIDARTALEQTRQLLANSLHAR